MMPKKKLTREEILAKKRIAERERKAKIKSDPDLYKLHKERDRERYRQRRENGKIKALSELPNHEQKTRREKSRESSKKNYYKNKEKRKREACEGGAVKNNSTVSGPVAVIQSTSPSILDEQMVRQVHADNSPEPKRLKLDDRVSLRSSPPTLSLRSGDRKRASSFHRKKYKCHKNVTGTDCETPNQTDTTHHASASLISSRRASSLSSIETFTDPNGELNSAYKSRTEPRSLIPLHDFVPSTLPSPSSDSSASRSSRSRIRREDGLPSNPKIKPTRLSRIPSLRRYKYRVNKEFQLLNKRILELKAENSKNKRIINRLRQRNSKKQTRKEILSDNRTETEKCESSSFKQNIVANSTRAMILSDMQNFYEDDENSRMCPGKRDFVTKNKVKKQKRYLNDTLLNLHTKFQKAHPEYQVSYSYFCREKPFWVQIPNVRTRETCLCQNHENFRLLVSSLNKNGIIDENSPDAVLKTLCCDASNIECLQRKCGNCKGNSLKYKEFDNSVKVHYFTWNKEKKTYTKEGIEKQTLQTVKQKVSVSPKELINKFEGIIDGYMSHVSKIIAQYRYIRKIKSELTVDQCIVHCDFSENYATKYAEEIQSFHFGSSRQQICLHTSVIYYVKNGLLTSQAFCTVSESLRHDAVAIWEHLVPIFSFLEEEVPSLESLHFITDSPTAQYRNKRMFFIMACLHWNLPSLKSVEWNYTESGHGKGAPDGVGGCIKSTADKVVARGNDIPDMDSLIKYLKQSVTNVKIEVVEESNMYEKDLLIPSDIREFKGTMSVHQVVWNADTKNILEMRKLSCSEPECLHKSKKCSHGQHIGVYDIGTAKRDTRPKNNATKQRKSKTITKSSHKSRVIFDMEPSDLDFPEMTKQCKMSKENKNKWSKSQYIKSNGTNLSDIELSANESFWGQVSTSRVNNLITPTLGDTAFSCLEMSNKEAENSSDDDNIF